MKMRRLLSCMMALLLAATLPLTAFAVDADISQGNVAIDDTYVSHTKDGAAQKDPHEGSVTVIQSDKSTPASNSVTIYTSPGSTVNVTLSGVNINTDGPAIATFGDGNVVIELDGENMVQSGDQHAGVEKQNSGKLTITDEDGGGSLTANGGDGGAGIGGKIESSASDITISDGKVTATGGEGGAGIGGGAQGGNGSNITISGGTVNATGGENAAGIGGGSNGNGSNITISSGTVNATGGNPPIIGSGDALEFGEGGGAGIGGGANGTSDKITVKFNAQVKAEGKGNAANIGNGYASEATEKQKDKVDLSGLSSFGNVNGVSGSDGGFRASDGNSSSAPLTVGNKATGIAGLTVSDHNGNALSNALLLEEEGTLKLTAPSNNVLVTGNKADLLQLNEDGVKQINLQTNRVNVSVSSEVLNKITGTGGFQLAADDTTVSISSVGGNKQQESGLKLTANKQPEKGTLQADFRLAGSKEGAGDVSGSLNTTLKVSTNAPEATLSFDQKFFQTLMNSEFGNLALAVGNLLATVDGKLAAITASDGSGSITIGDKTVNMNGFQFSAGDSSENDQLADKVNYVLFMLGNKLKTEKQPQAGSTMVVDVGGNASLQSASLEVTGGVLQALIDQGVEETTLSVNGKTTSFKNTAVLKQIEDSQLGVTKGTLHADALQAATFQWNNGLPFVQFGNETDSRLFLD